MTVWCQFRIFCSLVNEHSSPKNEYTALLYDGSQNSMIKNLYYDSSLISFLCIIYKTRQINMEFSEAFEWTEFLHTLNGGIFAVRIQLEFYLVQGSFTSGLSRYENSINHRCSCQEH